MDKLISKISPAFTLAEVLITIAVIGIVAALTIPAIINNTQDKELKSSLKKNYAVLSQATMQLAQDNGGTIKNIVAASWGDGFAYKISQYVKYNLISAPTFIANGIQPLGNCWANTNTVKRLDGTQGAYGTDFYVDNGNSGCFITNDGAYWASYRYQADCTFESIDCTVVYIDVNGPKGPNQQGRDIYAFHIKENGAVKPWAVGENLTHFSTLDCTTRGTGCAAEVIKGN